MCADGALVVEWPERGEGVLPLDNLVIHIQVTGPSSRILAPEAHGQRAEELARALVGLPSPKRSVSKRKSR